MNNLKQIYACIILLFTIFTLIETYSGILFLVTVLLNLNLYFIILGKLLLYIAIFYVVLYKVKELPEIKLWFILLIFSVYILPKDFFYTYTIENLREFSKISDIDKAGRVVFRLLFAFWAYIRYCRVS